MGLVFDISEELQPLYGLQPSQFDTKSQALSKLGSPYWAADAENRWFYMPVMLGGVQLWNPIMRVTARKTIVETQLTERPGSVKEIIHLDDYVINIRGIIKRSDGAWPHDEVTQLKGLWEQNKSVAINSVLTSVLLKGRDESVVITNLTMPEKRGQSIVAYELEMITDTSFDLEIKD